VKPETRIIQITLLCILTIALFACGGGGGERFISGIPTPIVYTDITTATIQSGTLANTDKNWYRIQGAIKDQLYSLEIFATRRDRETQGAIGTWANFGTIPLLHIYRPGTTPGTLDLYLEQDFSGALGGGLFNWEDYGWGKQDLDIPVFRIPADGDYYISVTTDNLGFGSVYSLRLKNITIPGLVDDIAPATNNTTPTNACDITNGATVYDHYTDAVPNYYKFTVPEVTPTIACFEVTAFRNGRFMGDIDYFDPSLILYNGLDPIPAAILADGLGDIDIDDYVFSDPRLCYKLTTAGDYLLEVNDAGSDGSSDYFLSFTANTAILPALEEAGGVGITNNIPADAEVIAYNTTTTEDVGGVADSADFFKFLATPGDLLELQVFDGTNSDDETNGVFVELFAPNPAEVLWASAPAADTNTKTKYYVTGPGAFTIRSILHADAGANQVNNYYYLKFTAPNNSTKYTFSLKNLREASSGIANGYTVEQKQLIGNDFPGLNSETLDRNGFGAGMLDTTDIDTFKIIPPTAGTLVTINVYAKAPLSGKAHDLDGFGSTLQPIVTVLSGDTTIELAKATYTSPSIHQIPAEGIVDPAPTFTVSYLSNGEPNNYIKIESELDTATDYPAYFIEVIPAPTFISP